MERYRIDNWEEETEARVARGVAYFKEGYNCAQSVARAFADMYDVPEDLITLLSASFGAGMGRMRETCGTASGMFMIAGLETASVEASQETKARNYAAVQELAADFKAQTGSLICRELLRGYVKNVSTDPTPEARTDEYYRKRPCVRMVELAIRTYMSWLKRRRMQL